MNNESENYGQRYVRVLNDWFPLLDIKFDNGIRLQMQHLVLLGVINGLSDTGNSVYISNQSLADLLHVKNSVIRDWLSKLEACDVITKTYTKKYKTGRILEIDHKKISELCANHVTQVAGLENKNENEKVLLESQGDATQVTGGCYSGSMGGVTQVAPNILINIKEKNNILINPDSNNKLILNNKEDNRLGKIVMVKCKDTGELMDRNLAYKVPNTKLYYSSEEGYNTRLIKVCDSKDLFPANVTYEFEGKYYSSEAGYNLFISNKEYKDKCNEFMLGVFGFKPGESDLGKYFFNLLSEYKNIGYKYVYDTMVGESNTIDNAMHKCDFKNHNQAINYIMKIVQNHILDYQAADKHKLERKQYFETHDNSIELSSDYENVGRKRKE